MSTLIGKQIKMCFPERKTKVVIQTKIFSIRVNIFIYTSQSNRLISRLIYLESFSLRFLPAHNFEH